MATSLKISKDKFIARLQEKLALYEQDQINEKKFREENEKHLKAYIAKRLKETIKDPSQIQYSHVNYKGELQINLSAGDYKEKSFERKACLNEWDVEEIKRTLALIQMAEGDWVPASLHKNVTRYL